MVRGSALRVTSLLPCGSIPDPIPFAVSKAVSRVEITEVTDAGENELVRSEQDDPRLRFTRPDKTIRYRASISFLRVDPGILNIVTGVPLVYRAGTGGFGDGSFGGGEFGVGLGDSEYTPDVVGFDAVRLPAKAFAMEVWSKLDQPCSSTGYGFGDGPFGEGPFGGPRSQRYGYTVFPFLKGGTLSGFQFSNGLVSFNLIGAQTRRGPKWGYGPYDLEGSYARLNTKVSRTTAWRTFTTTALPPVERCGIQTLRDVLDNGTAADPGTDTIDGQFVVTSSDIIEGGNAA